MYDIIKLLGETELPKLEDRIKWLSEWESFEESFEQNEDSDTKNDCNSDEKNEGSFDISPLPSLSDVKASKYHFLGGDLQFDYMKRIAKEARILTPRIQQHIETIQAIYNDVSSSRPAFCGGPDHYRKRRYFIDRETLNWSVHVEEDSRLSL